MRAAQGGDLLKRGSSTAPYDILLQRPWRFARDACREETADTISDHFRAIDVIGEKASVEGPGFEEVIVILTRILYLSACEDFKVMSSWFIFRKGCPLLRAETNIAFKQCRPLDGLGCMWASFRNVSY